VTQFEYQQELWRQSTRIFILVILLCSAILVQYWLVSVGRTDGRMDSQTDIVETQPQHIPRQNGVAR